MDDSGIDRAISEFIVKAIDFIRRLNWKRIAIGFAIYAALMIAGQIIGWPIALLLATTGHTATWFGRIIAVYVFASFCFAIWGSGQLVRKLKK